MSLAVDSSSKGLMDGRARKQNLIWADGWDTKWMEGASKGAAQERRSCRKRRPAQSQSEMEQPPLCDD